MSYAHHKHVFSLEETEKCIRAVGGEIPGLYPVKSSDQTVAQACDLLIVEIWELNSTVQRILGIML